MSAHTLARTTDPVSSHQAAREHVESGRNDSQKAAILRLLVLQRFFLGGKEHSIAITSREFAKAYSLDRYMVARRLADLRAEGKVIQSPREEMRKCRVSGRLAVTWRLA